MVHYWIEVEGSRLGPLTLDELRGRNLTADTPVWRDGLTEWTVIGDLPDTAWLCPPKLTPAIPSIPSPGQVPPVNNSPSTPPPHPESGYVAIPETYLVWNVVALIFCCAIPAIVGLVYSSKARNYYMKDDYCAGEQAAGTAKTWLIVSIVAGVIWWPISVLMALASE